MNSTDYLFPNRLTRRDFLRLTGAVGMAAGLSGVAATAAEKASPTKIGSGKFTYTLDEQWGKLPGDMKYGWGCALVVDARDRVFVTSRSANPCVAIFDKDGQLLETWSKDFAGKIGFDKPEQVAATAHGLYWSKEGNEEFLYWTENISKAKDAPGIGARVYKTDLNGKVLYTIGKGEKESSTSQKFDFVSPTDVAIGLNGDIYVVDGYGSQLLHRFDKNFKLIQTIGGKGKEHGKFQICHGIWISTLRKEPEVYVADRANNRAEVYSLDLKYLRTISDLRLPCCFYQHDGLMYVPELGARVTILDPDDKVVAHLGDGKDANGKDIKDAAKRPEMFATPHALTLTSNGDLYVTEWLPFGRPRKFKRTPA